MNLIVTGIDKTRFVLSHQAKLTCFALRAVDAGGSRLSSTFGGRFVFIVLCYSKLN